MKTKITPVSMVLFSSLAISFLLYSGCKKDATTAATNATNNLSTLTYGGKTVTQVYVECIVPCGGNNYMMSYSGFSGSDTMTIEVQFPVKAPVPGNYPFGLDSTHSQCIVMLGNGGLKMAKTGSCDLSQTSGKNKVSFSNITVSDIAGGNDVILNGSFGCN